MQRACRVGDHHPWLPRGEGDPSLVLEELGDRGGYRRVATWLFKSAVPGAESRMDCRLTVGMMIESRCRGPVSAILIPAHRAVPRGPVDVYEEVFCVDDLHMVGVDRRELVGFGVWEVFRQGRRPVGYKSAAIRRTGSGSSPAPSHSSGVTATPSTTRSTLRLVRNPSTSRRSVPSGRA